MNSSGAIFFKEIRKIGEKDFYYFDGKMALTLARRDSGIDKMMEDKIEFMMTFFFRDTILKIEFNHLDLLFFYQFLKEIRLHPIKIWW